MTIDLAEMAKRQGVRRSAILLRDFSIPQMLATDLYRACFMPIVDSWATALAAIEAQYERTLSAMTTDAPADLQGDIEAASTRASALAVTLGPKVRDWVSKVERWHRSRWAAAVEASTRIDLAMLLGPGDVQETLEAVIARNVALITDVSAQARSRIADAVFRGLVERRPSREVASEIRGAVDKARRRSRAIASDQANKLHSALSDQRRRDVGISTWAWAHSEKANPRPEHQARDGLIYSDDPADVGKQAAGQTIRTPPQDRPATLPYCACRARAVLLLD